jgi:hypothetical protein
LARHNKNQFGWTYQELRLENKKTVPQPCKAKGAAREALGDDKDAAKRPREERERSQI